MDSKWLARGGAIAFVAVVITITALEMRDAPRGGEPAFSDPAVTERADPLAAELVRCQSIGQAGASDGACLRAWAENRRRFLAPGGRPAAAIVPVENAAADLDSNAAAPAAAINDQVR